MADGTEQRFDAFSLLNYDNVRYYELNIDHIDVATQYELRPTHMLVAKLPANANWTIVLTLDEEHGNRLLESMQENMPEVPMKLLPIQYLM